jgi:hypothetical protein
VAFRAQSSACRQHSRISSPRLFSTTPSPVKRGSTGRHSNIYEVSDFEKQKGRRDGGDAAGKRSEWLATRPGNVQILFSENPIGASLFKNAQSRAGKHSDIVFRKTNFPFLTRAGNAQILFSGIRWSTLHQTLNGPCNSTTTTVQAALSNIKQLAKKG